MAQNHPKKSVVPWLFLYLVFVGVLVFSARITDLGIPQVAESALSRLHSVKGLSGIRFGHLEAAANVAIFVPVGFMLGLLMPRRRWWLAVVFGAGLSVLIELFQFVALSQRSATARDVFCNLTGTVIGAVISVVWVSMRHRTRNSISGPKT